MRLAERTQASRQAPTSATTGTPITQDMSDRVSAGVPQPRKQLAESPGRALDPAVREYMEPRLAHDFSRVRVHTDARAAESARAVGAPAYTVGRDIVFGAGRYEPGTDHQLPSSTRWPPPRSSAPSGPSSPSTRRSSSKVVSSGPISTQPAAFPRCYRKSTNTSPACCRARSSRQCMTP